MRCDVEAKGQFSGVAALSDCKCLLGSKSGCEARVPDMMFLPPLAFFFFFPIRQFVGFNMYWWVFLCKEMPYMCRQLWMPGGRACQTS